jgi:hypothetical protein
MKSKRASILAGIRILAVLILLGFSAVSSSAQSPTPDGPPPSPLRPEGLIEPQGFLLPAAVSPGGSDSFIASGMDFKPYVNSTPYHYYYAGLVNDSGGGAYFVAPVHLPNGATITKYVLYYFDYDSRSGYEVTGSLLYHALNGQFYDTSAKLTSSGYYGAVNFLETTTFSMAAADNTARDYEFMAYLPPSQDVRLIGMRLDFTYSTTLPAVSK